MRMTKLGLLFFVCGFATSVSANQHSVTWTPSLVTHKALAGTVSTVQVTFTTSGTLSDVRVRLSPNIRRIVSVSTSFFASVPAKQTQTLTILFTIPKGIRPQSITGRIRLLRAGDEDEEQSEENDEEGLKRRSFAVPLFVHLEVLQPNSSDIPSSIAQPSPDRITTDADGQKLVRDEIVVMLDLDTSGPESAIQQIARTTAGFIIGAVPATLTYQLQYTISDLSALEGIRHVLEGLPNVKAASHSYLQGQPLVNIPNDSGCPAGVLFENCATKYNSWDENNPAGNNWNLEFIKAPSAWDITTGSPAVSIGIIDADMDAAHGDLRNNVRSTLGPRTPLSGPSTGHGTHVAGIVCAEGNNGMGVAGLMWSCSLRLYDYGPGPGVTQVQLISPLNAMLSMVEAFQDGARIVNLSSQWIDTDMCGVSGTGATLQKVAETNAIFAQAMSYVSRHPEKGPDVLWVFAAGNECRDAEYASPASLTSSFRLNTITVASIGEGSQLSRLSNWGSNWGSLVTVAAPGENILSTLPRSCFLSCVDQYGLRSGTSMAAPHVTGLAGLVLSKHPEFSAAQIKQCILAASQSSGSAVDGQKFRVINAPEAVNCQRPYFLSFVEGDPDKPGDGTFISAGGGIDSLSFELSTPIPLSGMPEGFTYTTFLPSGSPQLRFVQLGISNLQSSGACRINFAARPTPSGNVAFNGAPGIFTNVSRSFLDSIVAFVNSSAPGCTNVTLNDLYFDHILLEIAAPPSFLTSLDAAAVGPGVDNFPGTRIP
jgi:subtilisin family serine protease